MPMTIAMKEMHTGIAPHLFSRARKRRPHLNINSTFLYSTGRGLIIKIAIAVLRVTGASTIYTASAKASDMLVTALDIRKTAAAKLN
jgi:hypothetical protein